MRSIWGLLRGESLEESLHIATANQRIAELRSLIKQGVDLNVYRKTIMNGGSSCTALHTAASYGLVRSAELLISSGASLDLLDDLKLTPLMCACSRGGPDGSRVAMLLISAGANVKIVRHSDKMTALKFAAGECDAVVIQALIDNGAEVDGPGNTDQTALMLAARKNNLDAIHVLIQNGADPRRPCGLRWAKGQTAAWLALNENQMAAFEYLSNF